MTLATPVPADTYTAFGNISTGHFTGDGATTAVPVNLGFSPLYVKLIDMSTLESFEWVMGMAATDTIKAVGSGPTLAIDTTSAIVSNGKLTSATEPGVYAPGTQEPNDGTLVNTTVSVYSPDKTVTPLTFNLPASNSDAWVWIAIG